MKTNWKLLLSLLCAWWLAFTPSQAAHDDGYYLKGTWRMNVDKVTPYYEIKLDFSKRSIPSLTYSMPSGEKMSYGYLDFSYGDRSYQYDIDDVKYVGNNLYQIKYFSDWTQETVTDTLTYNPKNNNISYCGSHTNYVRQNFYNISGKTHQKMSQAQKTTPSQKTAPSQKTQQPANTPKAGKGFAGVWILKNECNGGTFEQIALNLYKKATAPKEAPYYGRECHGYIYAADKKGYQNHEVITKVFEVNDTQAKVEVTDITGGKLDKRTVTLYLNKANQELTYGYDRLQKHM